VAINMGQKEYESYMSSPEKLKDIEEPYLLLENMNMSPENRKGYL
jgi:hypothetical protein